VPEQAADRKLLRELCEQALAFENHFLEQYKPFLLAELQHHGEAIRLFAARRLRQVIYHDRMVNPALEATVDDRRSPVSS
jgi:hypothetical protein